MRVRVLGPLQVTDDSGRSSGADDLPRRVRQVLAVLAARHDRVQTKDALADAVWGDALPGNHFAALEHYVSVLRRRLDPDRPTADSFIVTRGGGYLFATGRAGLDLAEVRDRTRLADSRPPGSAERLDLRRIVLDLVVDLPFGEDEDADWATGPRAEIRAALLRALLELAEHALPGDPERALRLAGEAITVDGYLERSYQLAMRACAALGRADDALRWFERCRRTLHDELALQPSPATEALRQEIVGDRRPGPPGRDRRRALALVRDVPATDPTTPSETAALPDLSHPPGSDSAEPLPFLGRRRELELILSGTPAPVIHVVGPIGAGKSALLAEVARRAPERVGVGSGSGSAGALRLSWMRAVLGQLGVPAAGLERVDRAMAEGRGLSPYDLEEVAAAVDRPVPVVLAIDDAERLDEVSVNELAWLRQRSPRLCVVLTYRYPSAVVDRPIAALDAGLVLRLAPLTESDLAPVGQLGLRELSGGVPALVAAARGGAEVAVSVAMHLARVRTRFLPASAWEVLRLSATVGPQPVGRIAELAGLPMNEVLTHVDHLMHAHLLDEDAAGNIRHSSAFVRAAVAEQVSTVHSVHIRRGLASSA